MADIELVVKIPEEDYENCIKYDALTSSIYKAIQRGTPLPKGHGRLVDADALDKLLEKEQEDLNLDDELSKAFGDGLTWASEVLSKEPTIIEADKDQKDES